MSKHRDFYSAPTYVETISGRMTPYEVLAEEEYDRSLDREDGPVFCEGVPCAGCGAYLKFPINCPLCGHGRRAA